MPDHGQRKNGILYAHSSFFSFVLCPIRFDGLLIFNGARDGSGASDLALFASRAKKKAKELSDSTASVADCLSLTKMEATGFIKSMLYQIRYKTCTDDD